MRAFRVGDLPRIAERVPNTSRTGRSPCDRSKGRRTLERVTHHPVTVVRPWPPWGTRYEVQLEITGPNGETRWVVTGWTPRIRCASIHQEAREVGVDEGWSQTAIHQQCTTCRDAYTRTQDVPPTMFSTRNAWATTRASSVLTRPKPPSTRASPAPPSYAALPSRPRRTGRFRRAFLGRRSCGARSRGR